MNRRFMSGVHKAAIASALCTWLSGCRGANSPEGYRPELGAIYHTRCTGTRQQCERDVWAQCSDGYHINAESEDEYEGVKSWRVRYQCVGTPKKKQPESSLIRSKAEIVEVMEPDALDDNLRKSATTQVIPIHPEVPSYTDDSQPPLPTAEETKEPIVAVGDATLQVVAEVPLSVAAQVVRAGGHILSDAEIAEYNGRAPFPGGIAGFTFGETLESAKRKCPHPPLGAGYLEPMDKPGWYSCSHTQNSPVFAETRETGLVFIDGKLAGIMFVASSEFSRELLERKFGKPKDCRRTQCVSGKQGFEWYMKGGMALGFGGIVLFRSAQVGARASDAGFQ